VIDSLASASLATYSDDQSIKSQALRWGYPNIDIIASGAMRAFIASNDQCVVLAFRGTDMNSLRDWFVDARATSTAVRHGKIHTGFYKSFKAMERDIDRTLNRHGASRKIFWVTGHSLGGALAGVYAYVSRIENILFKGPDIDRIITFGQPLFANEELSKIMRKEFFKRYYRVVNGIDIVSTVPFWFNHFGSLVWLKEPSIEFHEEAILAGGPSGGGISEADIPPELTPTEASLREFLDATNPSHQPDARSETNSDGQIPVGVAWPRRIADHLMTQYVEKILDVVRQLQ
jgi:pimeloyl-ACP methyl ester carboxylesterase